MNRICDLSPHNILGRFGQNGPKIRDIFRILVCAKFFEQKEAKLAKFRTLTE